MGKSWEHFQHLDEGEYTRDIARLSEHEVQEHHAVMERKILTASAGAGTSLSAAFYTAGVSLFATAIAARRLNVNMRRKAIIEARLEEMGWEKYHIKKRDMFIPVAATTVAGLIAPGSEAIIGHLTGHAASHVAGNLAAHHGSQAAASLALSHPATFVHAVEHGAVAQISEITHTAVTSSGVAVHAASQAPPVVVDFATSQASAFGYEPGDAAARALEVEATKAATKKAASWGMRSALDARDDKKAAALVSVETMEICL